MKRTKQISKNFDVEILEIIKIILNNETYIDYQLLFDLYQKLTSWRVNLCTKHGLAINSETMPVRIHNVIDFLGIPIYPRNDLAKDSSEETIKPHEFIKSKSILNENILAIIVDDRNLAATNNLILAQELANVMIYLAKNSNLFTEQHASPHITFDCKFNVDKRIILESWIETKLAEYIAIMLLCPIEGIFKILTSYYNENRISSGSGLYGQFLDHLHVRLQINREYIHSILTFIRDVVNNENLHKPEGLAIKKAYPTLF